MAPMSRAHVGVSTTTAAARRRTARITARPPAGAAAGEVDEAPAVDVDHVGAAGGGRHRRDDRLAPERGPRGAVQVDEVGPAAHEHHRDGREAAQRRPRLRGGGAVAVRLHLEQLVALRQPRPGERRHDGAHPAGAALARAHDEHARAPPHGPPAVDARRERQRQRGAHPGHDGRARLAVLEPQRAEPERPLLVARDHLGGGAVHGDREAPVAVAPRPAVARPLHRPGRQVPAQLHVVAAGRAGELVNHGQRAALQRDAAAVAHRGVGVVVRRRPRCGRPWTSPPPAPRRGGCATGSARPARRGRGRRS